MCAFMSAGLWLGIVGDVTAESPKPPTAEIKMHKGAPTLFINGVANAGLTYMWEEWFYWSTTGSSDGLSDLEDYSAPMVSGFRKWLGKKYAGDGLLQHAWNEASVTLATAGIPTRAERQATGLFVWRDPAIQRKVIDYYEFYCENVTEIIRLLAQTVKEATHGEQLVGVFYGYMFFAYADNWMQDNGHLALHKLLQCKDIDFLTAPSAYAFRELGTGYSTGQAATDAVRLHGKYYMGRSNQSARCCIPMTRMRRCSGCSTGKVWRDLC